MELSIEQIIKIILGLAVIVAVIIGLSLFGGQILSFIKNLPGEFLTLIWN